MLCGMTSSEHHTKALRHLEASIVARQYLDDLYARPGEVDKRVVAQLHDQIRMGMKLAEVHATLAVSARLEEILATGKLEALR